MYKILLLVLFSYLLIYNFLTFDEKFNYKKKNIVLITSKINVSDNKFSYTDKRSIYSIDERYNQTINTISSVRKYIQNCYIVLVDNSILDNEMVSNLNLLTDKFINITDDEKFNYNTDINEYKAFGEISQQLCFYDHFLSKIDINEINNFFKISGRYFINETFDYSQYDNENIIFKKKDIVTSKDFYYTSFYKINPSSLELYFIHLQNLMNNQEKYKHVDADFEVIVPFIFNNKTLVDNLGITQILSGWIEIDNI